MSARPVPRHGVMSIDAYVPGKSAAPAGVKVHKLSSNETPLGPSPKAVEAASTATGKLAYYPDGSTTRLREAIAHKFGLDPARIVCGNGSDELLSLLTMSYIGPGDEAMFCEHGFLVYRIAILAAGGTPGRGEGARADGGRGRHPRRRDAAHEDRLPRQPEQPDGHLHLLRRGASACIPGCRRTSSSCSTPLMRNTCGATITRRGSSSSRRARMSS